MSNVAERSGGVRMTIDEAITFCNEKSKNIKLRTEPSTFEQIAEWLEESKQYREMEKRLEAIYGDHTGLLEIVVEHLERHDGADIGEPVFKSRLLTDEDVDKWEAYKAIGTPEECRAAVEKQIPKKIIHPGCYDNDGIWRTWNGIDDVPYDLCPSCETNLCTSGAFGRDKKRMKYCENCGQKLDWSNEE